VNRGTTRYNTCDGCTVDMWDAIYDEWHEYDARIDRAPSSAHFLLYQEDDNVSSDSEDLRDCTPLYIQHLATAPTASMARTLVRGSLALSTR
jgi:hypothetical protein